MAFFACIDSGPCRCKRMVQADGVLEHTKDFCGCRDKSPTLLVCRSRDTTKVAETLSKRRLLVTGNQAGTVAFQPLAFRRSLPRLCPNANIVARAKSA